MRVCVVTGSRAEFGLLRPVIKALRDRSELETIVLATGAHMLRPAMTLNEVESAVGVDVQVQMQRNGSTGRWADVEALSRGVEGIGRALEEQSIDWVVVLGDRIEAFAAAIAGSLGGIAVAHIHAGDRAEGIADEAMRHAISKLAHVHLAATQQSGERLLRMGEPTWRVRVVGSPAVDGLKNIQPLDDARYEALRRPELVILHHPAGQGLSVEGELAEAIHAGIAKLGQRTMWLAPNFDAGREAIEGVRVRAAESGLIRLADHLPHEEFRSLLKRLGEEGGVLIGNSSAGLIEAAALKLPAVDIGPRQAGREHAANVIHVDEPDAALIRLAIERALELDRTTLTHPYGDGDSARRIAQVITEMGRPVGALKRKRNAY